MPSDLQRAIESLARTIEDRFTQPEFLAGCEIQDVTDIDQYATANGWIEVDCAHHGRQRVRYKGFPAGIQVGDELDIFYFPDRKVFEIKGTGGTTSTGIDAVKVSRVWEPDGSAVALRSDNNGRIGINLSSMTAMLDIDQPSNIAAIPVIKVDQADIGFASILFSANSADNDIRIFEVEVTGAPALDWDESEDAWSWNKGHRVTAGNVVISNLMQADDIICDTNMYVNETANSKQVVGLTINQDAQDDEILSFKASEVAHGMTGATETDTYGHVLKTSATAGGLGIRGFSEGHAGCLITGVGSTADTAKSTAAQGAMMLQGSKKSGTGFSSLGTDENVFVVRNHGNAVLLIDAEGDLHYDGTTNAGSWDTEDDTELLRALTLEVSDPATIIRSEFDEFVHYHRKDLIRMDILSEGGFINLTQVVRVLMGAAWQQNLKLKDLEAKLNGKLA